VTAETCPQYLLLDESSYQKKGVLMKSNPSIKTRADKAALWEAIADRTIDMIASDHAPHTLQEKLSGRTIFDDASGFPGLETSLALMLTCVNKELLSLQNLVRLTSENPAKVWGVFPTKGCVAVGSDADLTVVDMKRGWKIDPDTFVSKAKYSPFEDYKAEGRAVYTVVRGLIVMEDGVVDKTPLGKMVVPEVGSAGKRGG
jgi:dihydroorotase